MKIKVLGYPWTIKVLEKKAFKKRFGRAQAITDLETQEIFINSKFNHLRVIAHELCHAFFHYCCQEELELDNNKWEEVLCDFVSLHGEEVNKLAKNIWKKLK